MHGGTAMSVRESKAGVSVSCPLRKLSHGKSKCITRQWLGATRSPIEAQVGLRVYSYVQMNPFMKQPSPFGRRKKGAALSEWQLSLRSHVMASGSAQRLSGSAERRHRGMECRAYLLAHGAAVTFWASIFKDRAIIIITAHDPQIPSWSWELDLCSCDLQRNIGA